MPASPIAALTTANSRAFATTSLARASGYDDVESVTLLSVPPDRREGECLGALAEVQLAVEALIGVDVGHERTVFSFDEADTTLSPGPLYHRELRRLLKT